MEEEKNLNSAENIKKKKKRICRPCFLGSLIIWILLIWLLIKFLRWVF